MRKTIAMFVSMAFLLGTTGFAVAQTTSTPSTPAPAPTQEKKPAKKSMTMEEKKAACLQKAGTDEAKKANCEKRFTAKSTSKKDTTTSGAAATPSAATPSKDEPKK